ncbi:MAG: SPOR domain-containing protein [Halothiobacillaceae bacterium]
MPNATLLPSLAAPTSTPKPATPTPISPQPTASITDTGKANATLPPLLAAPTSTPKPAASTPAARPAAEPKPSLAAPKPATQLDQLEKKTANWYAQQKGEQYVLQVVSLDSEAEVDRFIEQNGLKDCHSFRQLRDGQTLHTLTCGLYSSRDAASQASAMLPEKARVGKPFPRRIDDIRKIMLP